MKKICPTCGKEFETKGSRIYCSDSCRPGFTVLNNKYKYMENSSDINYSKVGAISEMMACNFLLNNGYEVFRNVASTGLIDIVVWKNGEIKLIDVKTIRIRVNLNKSIVIDAPKLKKIQVDKNIIPLYVTRDGLCAFTIEELSKNILQDNEDGRGDV